MFVYIASRKCLIELDADDYERIKDCSMFLSSHGYAIVYFNGKNEYLHRLVSGAGKGDIVDHRNRNIRDNRKDNLRLVNQSANLHNSTKLRPNNTSGFKNIGWSTQKGKWRARLKLNYQEIHVGFFDDLTEAVVAVEFARVKYIPFSPENSGGVV